jgi:hypothetical protein
VLVGEDAIMPVDALTILDASNPYVLAPAGYEKIPSDLNKGAGGDFIYLAFRTAAGPPITGLFVVSQNVAGAQPPAGYRPVEPQIDLNKGAGGRYLYLCFTTDSGAGPPIQHISIVSGPSNNPPIMPGWHRVGVDLNEGSGGDFIYIVYTTQP